MSAGVLGRRAVGGVCEWRLLKTAGGLLGREQAGGVGALLGGQKVGVLRAARTWRGIDPQR